MSTLQSARVRDFQSIKDVSVEFGGLTVIVGPSNSGKSAFLRGLRACLRNTFNPSMVRQGTSKSLIDLSFSDGTNVGIERGKSLSTYKLDNGSSVFTKSARSVPDDVAKAIRLPLIEGVDASFAFQFDKPFLLSESGATAANVVGSLTNVSLLHSAVREANRRRQEAAGTLKVRQGDVVKYSAQLEQFRDLVPRAKALQKAHKALSEAQQHEEQLRDLLKATEALEAARRSLEQLEAVAPPDVSATLKELQEANARLDRLERTVVVLETTRQQIEAKQEESEVLLDKIKVAEVEYGSRLQQLGTCPTCQQQIH